jgi:uncharacterized membrane protein
MRILLFGPVLSCAVALCIHASLLADYSAAAMGARSSFCSLQIAHIPKGSIMKAQTQPSRFSVTSAIFDVLDPIPFGFFVAALIFDIIYANTAVVLWVKAAAWLISIGLVFAIVPQLINLARTWFTRGRGRTRNLALNFWLNVVAIVAALLNAFVHSRDAYATMPDGVWLSALTVLALVIGRVLLAGDKVTYKETTHDKEYSHGPA